MNSKKHLKGGTILATTSISGTTVTSGDHICAVDLSYVSGGYIDTSLSPDFSSEGAYLYTQYESNDVAMNFSATTVAEVQEDLEKMLIAFSESGVSFNKTKSVVEQKDLGLNGTVTMQTYNWG